MRAMSSAPAQGVFGVVVTYNPGPELGTHLARLREQIPDVVVIDNGSTALEPVRSACHASGCRLIANGANLGIATALNQGAAQALAAGAAWLATFDQDSLLPAGAIETMLRVCEAHPERARIGVLCAAHRDRATGAGYLHARDVIRAGPGWRILRTSITSGSLVRCDVLRQAGMFEDPLFIDFVDHEFFLRLRRAGWLLLEASDAVMEHSLGASTVHMILGRRVVLTHHAATRRYYITRNQLEISRRNLIFDPGWSVRGLLTLAYVTFTVLVLEEGKAAKFRAVGQGVFDFLTRRFGPRH